MKKKNKLGKLRDTAKKEAKEVKEVKEEKEESSGVNQLAKLAEAKPDDPDRELDKYELDSKLNTLMEAHDIMHNEKHMKQVRAHADKKKSKIESIADIRKAYKDMPADESMGGKMV